MANELARQVAYRLCDKERLDRAIRLTSEQSPFPSPWIPHSTAGGDAGLAMMCGYLDASFPGEGWDRDAHRFIQSAAASVAAEAPIAAGVLEGLAGVALTALLLSNDGRRYRKFLETVETALIDQVGDLCDSFEDQARLQCEQWDLVSGLAGIGGYLLLRCDHPPIAGVMTRVLDAIVTLTDLVEGLPRWYMPAAAFPREEMRREFPDGHLNCGLAHGIPGPLAMMSLAWLTGQQTVRLRNAMEFIAEWLLAQQLDDEWGPGWPTAVPVISANGGRRALNSKDDLERRPTSCRTAWCYGNPGVARALWLAGSALDQPRYRNAALAALQAVFRRPASARGIDSPTFCHGKAGLLQVTLRFAHETRLPWLAEAATSQLDAILASYEPHSLLGFRDLAENDLAIDKPGLLDGAAGIAMVLLAATTGAKPEWDRLFLLS